MEKFQQTLILYYKNIGKFALNVLAGALDAHPETQNTNILFPTSVDQLIKAINQTSGRVVIGWSFYSPQFINICQELQFVKSKINNPKALSIAGGVHATSAPQQTLAAGFDYVAIGEGEQIIVDIILAFNDDKPLDEVRGLANLKNGEIRKNGKGKTIDLNHYPACSKRYNKFGPIEITRGCIYGCKFCQTPFINKAKFRHRSIENIIDIVVAMKELGLRDFRFITPTSLSYGSQNESVNLPAIEELLKSIRATIGKRRRIFFGTFPSEIRPEHVSLQVLRVLKKFVDNDNIIIGGQSGAQNILESSNRGHNIEVIINAVKLSVSAGFKPNVDFLFGLPGETEHDAQATLHLAHKLTDMGARIHTHTFMPLPGTPYQFQPPGTISIETRDQLVDLTSKGKAYGKWQHQIKVARQLSKHSQTE